MGTRKKNKAQKLCQFKRFSDRFQGRRFRMDCEGKQECMYKGIAVCDKHRRLLQSQDIEKLTEYQKFEEEINSIQIEPMVE